MYVVIMAGGGGTRLWPLSTPERPKPFLPLLGEHSLLQRTAWRLFEGPELGLQPGDVTVVAERRHVPLVQQQLPDVRVLGEPRGRNTAAAITLATLAIARPDDEVMLVLPADQAIADEAGFRRVLADAVGLAGGALGVAAPLVTLGIRPDRPATEYGYLIPDLERGDGGERDDGAEGGDGIGRGPHPLRAFEEKPSHGRAVELRELPGVAWNAGIFLWTRAAIRAAIGRYTGLLTLIEGTRALPGTLDEAYERIQPVSIDYAVMEGAAADGQVLMAAMDVGWSDLGSWTALLDAMTGGYGGQARVLAPGEEVTLGESDALVRRERGRLVLELGPAGTMEHEQPMALLPAAREHGTAIGALLERVNRQEGRA